MFVAPRLCNLSSVPNRPKDPSMMMTDMGPKPPLPPRPKPQLESMERADVSEVIQALQQIIYSTRETAVEDHSISIADTLRFAFQKSTAEFVRPAFGDDAPESKKNAQVLEQQLRLLKLENRKLQSDLENVLTATTHMQRSHRATMNKVINGELPSQSRGEGWTLNPLDNLLSTDIRRCEVNNLTQSEEKQRLQVFASSVKQIVRDAESKFYGQRDVADRVAFENFVMRRLLKREDDNAPVDYQELINDFKKTQPEELPVDAAKTPEAPFTLNDVYKAHEEYEDQFWKENEVDRIRRIEKEDAEEEQRRKDNAKDEGAAAVEQTLLSVMRQPTKTRKNHQRNQSETN